MDDLDILLDLRKLSGNVKSTKYDPFWDKLSVYVEEHDLIHLMNVVTQMFLKWLIAISLHCLRDIIKKGYKAEVLKC